MKVSKGLTCYLSKSASFAKHHMRNNRNTQYRLEQQVMACQIRKQFPEYSILMEEMIPYDKESGERTCAIVDILVEEIGVVYRLNGQIHNSNRQEEHDWEQKVYLEALGYMVIDVET